MQTANLTRSRCSWIWAWVGPPPEFEAVGEPEPQAAINAPAAIALVAIARYAVRLNMAQVIAGCRSHECNTMGGALHRAGNATGMAARATRRALGRDLNPRAARSAGPVIYEQPVVFEF
jgi:hypothetical protein